MKKRYCEEGCGRLLWPHEVNYCGICCGADDETTRPSVESGYRGVVGAFVLPSRQDNETEQSVKPSVNLP